MSHMHHLQAKSQSIGRIDLVHTHRRLLRPFPRLSPRLETNDDDEEYGVTVSLERTIRPPSLLSSSPCCGYTSFHVLHSASHPGHAYQASTVIDWKRRRRGLLSIRSIVGCGRDKAKGCERCRRHYGLPTYQVWACNWSRREEGTQQRRPMLMFQGSNDLELASFFGLDEIDFVDKWAVLTQDDPQGSPSSSSHDLTDLLIRPGLMRPGYSSTLPLSDPDSMDQLEINDPNELEILTKKGTVRKDMTPWRRAVVVRKAKESNQKLRGMQVHKFSEGQWEGDSEEDIAPIRMRRMRPIIIERRLDHDR